LKAEMGGAKWATLSRDSKLIYYGRKLGTAVEDNARIAKFIDELHKGQDFRGAAQATKHALFDYTDLTHVEKTVAKRIAPFYTWSRKNIPLQVEGMLKSPGKYKAIDTARQEIEANSQDPNEYVLGNWLLENYAIRTKVEVDPQTGKRTPYYFMLGGWLPAADLWSMSANPTQFLLNQITPLAKVPAELWANKDFFTGREIQHYDSEKVSALGDRVRISPKMKHALRNIRILAMADAMLPESYKGVMPQGVRDMTADEKLLHFFTGIKLYGQDLLTQRMFDELDTQKRVKELTKYKVKGMRKESGVTDEERQGLDKEIQQQIDKSMRIFGAAPPSTDRAHSWEFVPTLPKQ